MYDHNAFGRGAGIRFEHGFPDHLPHAPEGIRESCDLAALVPLAPLLQRSGWLRAWFTNSV